MFDLSKQELDALEDLEDEIATLAVQIHAATHRQLVLIAEFDRRRGWELGGHITCAHWLAWRTGIDLGAARQKVRAARALERLPAISAAMERGELSFSKVRALTRVATAEDETELLEIATTSSAAQLERAVRGWKRRGRLEDQELDELRHRSRTLSIFPGDDGMYVVTGRVEPEVALLLMRALEAAADALFWKGPDLEGVPEATPKQRRADALGFLAERALAGGLNQEGGGADAPVSGGRAERYQVVLQVDQAGVAPVDHAAEEPRKAEWECAFGDGSRVSAETSERLSCDAGLVQLTKTAAGEVLDIGRRTRTVPPSIRRALEVRDRGCRFPGCGRRFTDAHHIRHWADGGETSLTNLTLLCRAHHRLLHEGGFTMQRRDDGSFAFFDPRQRPLPALPPLKRRTAAEVAAMKADLGIRPG